MKLRTNFHDLFLAALLSAVVHIAVSEIWKRFGKNKVRVNELPNSN
jgi:hypothetical protein